MPDDTKFEKIRLLEDQPIEQLEFDHLGLMPWAKMIAGAAVGTRGPFTIGVHQRWGHGKTTLLRLAQRLIEKEYKDDAVTVWFNAWQFEREEHPLFPLIGAIADEVERSSTKSKAKAGLQKVGSSLRALTRGMKFSGEMGVPLLAKFGVEFDADKALQAEELIGKQSDPLQAEMMYHSAFRTLEKVSREGDGFKIVVFIDDLDRCQPDKAVNLLESVKLILSQPGFVFVLAVDREVIECYLEKEYAKRCGDENKHFGRFYLDKIIQLPIYIPSHASRFDVYVERVVDSLDSDYGNTEQLKALRSVQHVLATGAENNPRNLVRLVNNFLLDCSLWPLIDRKGDKKLLKYHKLTQDVASALAFDRILQRILRDMHDEFIRDDELCEAILEDGLDRLIEEADQSAAREELGGMQPVRRTHGLIKKPDTSAAGQGTPDQPRPRSQAQTVDNRVQMARRLHTHAQLLEALREHGQKWLTDQTLRIVVHEFSQSSRAESAMPQFEEHLASAIRKSLGLGPEEPIPSDRLGDVTRLYLSGTGVTDAGLREIAKLTNLQWLDLSRTGVTDAGLREIAKLTNLQELGLSGTGVTDAGLREIARLTNLQGLFLGGTGVTDAGLREIAKLTNLQALGLSGTGVTDAGRNELKRALPMLGIGG
ncbi:MAG: P-loop NTPase fold protein [Armatimonadota bacterium]|nr:P-loop NTPase fold protein [Armatimonadota bacterium]